MQAPALHQHFRQAISRFSPPQAEALRSLIEAGSVENFLTGLLFLELHTAGVPVSREFPIDAGTRCAADLTLHLQPDIHIELKQLNLKDGCIYAPQNLINDLIRHVNAPSIGILYVSDERRSTTALQYSRHGGANRRAKRDVQDILSQLPTYFGNIFPATAEQALPRFFPANGGLSLYAFVVSAPLLPAKYSKKQS